MLDTKGCRGQLMNIAQRLLSIDSPSGFTDQVVREAEQIAGITATPSAAPTRETWWCRCPAGKRGSASACAPTSTPWASWCAPSPPKAC